MTTPQRPVPVDADLRDFTFMPIEIGRLFGSTFHARANDAEWRGGFTLWLKSWHQVPAGSLPKEDIELCRLAELGRDVRTWKKIKAMALHGWSEHADGRLYHETVSKKANEAWKRKIEQRLRTLNARIAALGKRLAAATEQGEKDHLQGLLHDLRQGLSQTGKPPVTDPVTATKGEGQGEGEGDSNLGSEPCGSGAKPPPAGSNLWGASLDWLQSVTKLSNARCRALVGKWRKDLGDDAALIELLAEAQRQNIQGPEAWLAAAIRARKQREPARSYSEAVAQREADPAWRGVQ